MEFDHIWGCRTGRPGVLKASLEEAGESPGLELEPTCPVRNLCHQREGQF